MNWILAEEKTERGKAVRVYRNSLTNGESKTTNIYTDSDGGKWWGFVDLFKIPIIRTAMARHIMDLFSTGLSLKDILSWCEAEKVLLKSDDHEKYEKLYKLVLEKENIAKLTANPIKQSLSLATVYILGNEERIDYFDEEISSKKLSFWGGDVEMTAFFLSWYNERTANYLQDLKKISQTVSRLQNKSAQNPQ